MFLSDTSFTADSCINVVLCANDVFMLQELKEEREVIYPPPKKESESIVATASLEGTEGSKSEAEGELCTDCVCSNVYISIKTGEGTKLLLLLRVRTGTSVLISFRCLGP